MTSPAFLPLPVAPAAFAPLLLVQEGPPAGAPAAAPTGGGLDMFILLLVPLAIFWFIAIFPERKARKKKEALLAALKKNDRVLLNGGLYATIAAVNEKDLTIRFDDGPTRVKVLRTAVASVLAGAENSEPTGER